MGKLEQKIKVGITGQAGFIGSHLYNYLGTKENIELIDFERSYFEDKTKLSNFVSQCDTILHIAAMNRHEDQQVIYNTNVNLVNQLIEACQDTNSTPKIIFSSSSQEEKDNLYGKSKRDGREALEQWAKNNNSQVVSLIIPNVFGPFGKPFYNSFIATFCHQIINGETPNIINDGEVNLIYINQLSEVFYKHIIIKQETPALKYTVPHTATKKVSEILNLLNHFNKEYVQEGKVPNVPINSFEINLFNTFTSFIPLLSYFPRKFTKHEDNRGAFVEIMRAGVSGQSSFSTTVPGITRGNHYHTRKIERFAVIQGKARIELRKINTDKVYSFDLDGKHPAYVDMPIWYTHNIKNIGETELITLFWINEPYNPEDADTYFVEV